MPTTGEGEQKENASIAADRESGLRSSTIVRWLIWLGVILFLWLLLRPVEVAIVDSRGQIDSSKMFNLAFARETKDKKRFWVMPYALSVYRQAESRPDDANVVRIEAPIEIRFELATNAEISGLENKAVLEALARKDDVQLRFMRLVAPEEVLERLRATDIAKGAIELQIVDEIITVAEKASPIGRGDESTYWTGVDSDDRSVRVVLAKEYLMLTLETGDVLATLEPLPPFDEGLYAMWTRSRSASVPLVRGATSSSGVPATECKCFVSKAERVECEYPSVHEAERQPLRVLIVRSPDLLPPSLGWSDPGYEASVGWLRQLLANTVPEKILFVTRHDATRVVLPVTTRGGDQSFWEFTDDLAQGEVVSEARRNNPTGFAYYEALRTLRDTVAAEAVVYVSSDVSGHCGLASSIPRTGVGFYAIVSVGCLRTSVTPLAHEVGHLFGARHELSEDTEGLRSGHAASWPVWSSGSYRGDVMSVTSTARIPHFSQSGASCDGSSIGNTRTKNNYAVVRDNLMTGGGSYVTGVKCMALRPGISERCWNASDESIPFPVGSVTPTAKIGTEKLEEAIIQLQAKKPLDITVLGFADQTGDYESNYILAFKRANHVREEITRKWQSGRPPRIYVCAYADEFRDCRSGDAELRAGRERRVELVVDGE